MKERVTFEKEMLNLGLSSSFGEASIGALREQEIIEPDTRKQVSDSFAIPFRIVCHPEISYKKTRTTKGATGTLISPRHVLAGHNLYTEDKLVARKVIVSPALNDTANSIVGITTTDWNIHPYWQKVRIVRSTTH